MSDDEGKIPNGGPVSAVPVELRERPQWVCWRLVSKEGGKKPTKVPYDAKTGGLASSTDPATWAPFDVALGAAGGYDGVGFVFSKDDPYVGIDLDDAIDPDSGEADPDAFDTIARFNTYAELSQSRAGFHLILKGDQVPGRKLKDRECYSSGRFFVVTGMRAVEGVGVEDRGAVLREWYAETFPDVRPAKQPAAAPGVLNLTDEQLWQKIANSKQGPKFRRLWGGSTDGYGSGSEADLALCSILAGWCRRDADRVDRMFRGSGLMRPKWDAKRGDATYGARTVTKAVDGVSWEYDPDAAAPTIVFGEPELTEADAEVDDVAGIEDLKRAGAEVKWLWPQWVQQGVLTAVAAQGGTGKTRWTADIVRRIRHRLPWPDGQPMELDPGPVVALWVVSDNHHDEMVTLCEAFGIADCVKVNASKADPFGGVTLEALEEFAELEKRVKKTRPMVLVIDTVGNATDKNLSRQEDAKAFYQPLQLIARRQGVAVLCLTHLNAGGKVLGRRALEKVRTCVRLSAEKINDSACKRRLEVIKSNSKYPDPLGVMMGGEGNEYDNEPPPAPDEGEGAPKPVQSKTSECSDWLKALIDTKPYPVGELRTLADGKGFSVGVFYDAVKLLKLEEVRINNRKWLRHKLDAAA